ncbi:MAG: apolipoprotein N-acyltransferase [Clostridia bacterium]|nr:apolipoprotein N-acyltransferase [Clostridia bacterium]
MKDTFARKPLLWLLLGAALTAVPVIFPIFGALQWVASIPMLIGLYRLFDTEKCKLWKAYRYGFLTVYVYYFFIYHWFVNLYPLDFVGLDSGASIVVVAAGWFGLPLLQAVLGGFIFLLYALIQRSGLFERISLLRPFVFASLWTVFEYSSTIGWTGVPWGRIALGQVECLPMLQSASLFGSYFIGWLLMAVNGLIAYWLLYRTKALVCGIVAGALLLSNLTFGLVALAIPEDPNAKTATVAVIQGNISSHDKWNGSASAREIYAELIRDAADEGAELVLLPETAFPTRLTGENRKFVSRIARECQIYLVVGAFASDAEMNEYNALYMVDPEGEISDTVYAKRHLVPFGEYVPMRAVTELLIAPLADLNLGSDLTEGTDTALFDTPWGKLGSLICFDSIYEQLTVDTARDGAELILLSTNDSWFRDSKAVYQHLSHAQLRAVESGRDIIRSANTGISAIISADGSAEQTIEPLVKGYAVGTVTLRTQKTLYTVIGNLFVFLCMGFVVMAVFSKLLFRALEALRSRIRAKQKTA